MATYDVTITQDVMADTADDLFADTEDDTFESEGLNLEGSAPTRSGLFNRTTTADF